MAAVIKALFRFDGGSEDSELVNLSYSFDQNIDNIGQPAGEVRGGVINVTLMTAKSNSRFAWMVRSDQKYGGSIDFIDRDNQVLKTVKFEEAYCVGYTEDYTAFDGQASGNVTIKDGAKEHLTLSCKKIDVEGEIHENTWEAF